MTPLAGHSTVGAGVGASAFDTPVCYAPLQRPLDGAFFRLTSGARCETNAIMTSQTVARIARAGRGVRTPSEPLSTGDFDFSRQCVKSRALKSGSVRLGPEADEAGGFTSQNQKQSAEVQAEPRRGGSAECDENSAGLLGDSKSWSDAIRSRKGYATHEARDKTGKDYRRDSARGSATQQKLGTMPKTVCASGRLRFETQPVRDPISAGGRSAISGRPITSRKPVRLRRSATNLTHEKRPGRGSPVGPFEARFGTEVRTVVILGRGVAGNGLLLDAAWKDKRNRSKGESGLSLTARGICATMSRGDRSAPFTLTAPHTPKELPQTGIDMLTMNTNAWILAGSEPNTVRRDPHL